MNNFAKEIINISIAEEMSKDYLNYAMSVIIGRALPDVRDGLKPVHRRVLYAMYKINNTYQKPFIKCARVVGEVMGKYHPHGDNSIYDALVRMAQNFSLKYTLIEGQGNFGSIDGDNAAAMRYTECRLQKITNELLNDIDKNTVDFIFNYDGKEKEPVVLPAKIPNLLINGSSGIAVGMITNIPPHNIIDSIDAIIYLIKNKNCLIEELINIIKAPDFPTGGIIYGISEIHKAYKTGNGKMIIRGKTHIEKYNKNKNTAIIIDEIPYQVNKKTFLERIIKLIQNKQIKGIDNLRDESDKSGMRIVIELKEKELPKIILNNLYKKTQLQEIFNINMVALVNKKPKLLNIKQILKYFILHRKEVVLRRTKFKIKKAKNKEHLLEGLFIAIDNIDIFINIIKLSKNIENAKEILLSKIWKSNIIKKIKKKNIKYILTNIQIQKILQIQLQKLTNLEKKKLIDKYKYIQKKILYLSKILLSITELEKVIIKELLEIKNNFKIENKYQRLSIIEKNISKLTIEDYINPQMIMITLSYYGYIKSQPFNEYIFKKNIKKNKQIIIKNNNDWIIQLFVIDIFSSLLCFSNYGKFYYLKVLEVHNNIEIYKKNIIKNILQLKDGEKITVILPLSQKNKSFPKNKYIVLSTSLGIIKKMFLSDFNKSRKTGIIVINLSKNDFLIGASLTKGNNNIMLFTDSGKFIKFNENSIKITNKNTKGIIGINLEKNQKVIDLIIEKNENKYILLATENGFGKIILIKNYICHNRGYKGIAILQTSKKNGKVVSAILIKNKDKIILICKNRVFKIFEIDKMIKKNKIITLIKNKYKLNRIQKISNNIKN